MTGRSRFRVESADEQNGVHNFASFIAELTFARLNHLQISTHKTPGWNCGSRREDVRDLFCGCFDLAGYSRGGIICGGVIGGDQIGMICQSAGGVGAEAAAGQATVEVVLAGIVTTGAAIVVVCVQV